MGGIFRNFSDPGTRVEIHPLSAILGDLFSAIDYKDTSKLQGPTEK